MGYLCRRFNCTPTAAIEELRHNPYIFDVLSTEMYREAYVAVERWESMTPDQQKDQTPPSGSWVKRVNANRLRALREEMAARKAEMEQAGR